MYWPYHEALREDLIKAGDIAERQCSRLEPEHDPGPAQLRSVAVHARIDGVHRFVLLRHINSHLREISLQLWIVKALLAVCAAGIWFR